MHKKRKSGGKRAVEAKHRARAAARRRDGSHAEAWVAAIDALGEPPSQPEMAHEWLGRVAVLIVKATIRDTAMPPEQMRRDAMKQIEQAQKAIGSAKLAAELRELYEALKADKEPTPPGDDDAAHLAGRNGEVRSAETDLL